MTAARPNRKPNRLAEETSPYLRQHAFNPVDWRPWGDEAFAVARRDGKPVFLSIGYSSCHWCHVMERESFEDDEIARILNERFVPVKVDREERPDVDDVYMTAVQLTTGRGGWPLSAFLLPDRRPFFGGTYFPPADRGGHPGFKTLLLRLSEAWRERRADVEEGARRLAEEIAASQGAADRGARVPLDAALRETLPAALRRAFDRDHAGFGTAPKFPPHGALDVLLRRAADGDADSRDMAIRTLEAMALGGIHDHLAGGFHRYSTDERWLVPHFEKMLYDNAQLLGTYARGAILSAEPLLARVARAIGDYLVREMRGPEGAFQSATDADSEGEEGKFFVWRWDEIEAVVGEDDAAFLGALYGATRDGNFRDEATGRASPANILHLSRPPSEDEERRAAPLREALRLARARRVPPGLDDKRLAGWNALAISGFAQAGAALREPAFLLVAREVADVILRRFRDADGRLLRTFKDGIAKIAGFLEDEAYLANGLLDLADAFRTSGDEASAVRAEDEAAASVERLRRRFGRRGAAGFTFSGEGNEELLVNGRDLWDKATPSGSASATRALLRLARRTGGRDLAGEARAALEEVSGSMARSPHGLETWFLALDDLVAFERERGGVAPIRSVSARSGPVEVVARTDEAPVRRGQAAAFALEVRVDPAFHLQGDDGLVIEAWAGSDVGAVVGPIPAATERTLADGSRERGRWDVVRVDVRVEAAAGAAPGPRPVHVHVRFRACGEGACRPDEVLALDVPLRVVR